MSPKWRWLAMALIACVIGGEAYGGALTPPERPRTNREYDALLRANQLWQCMAQSPRLNGGPPPHYCIPAVIPTGKIPDLIDEPMIILARVVGVGPEDATLLVLKSWQGSLSAGRVVHAPQPSPIIEPQYRFHADDGELLIFAHIFSHPGEPPSDQIGNPAPSRVWRAAEAQPLIEALDEAARWDRALRIDVDLKKCLADAAMHPKAESSNARCEAQAHLDELLLIHTEYDPGVIAAREKVKALDQAAKETQKQPARQHEQSP